MILDGLDLDVVPLGVDRAFGQSSPTHDVDFAMRRARYGIGADTGFLPGLVPWRRAGIPVTGYLFERPRKTGEDPIDQAEALLRSARSAGLSSVVVDWERDGRAGFPPPDELQAIVDHLDAAGFPVMGYWSEGTPPGRSIRHLAARWIANYSRKPKVHADCWQWTSSPWDRSVWLGDDATFRLIFGSDGGVLPVPLPSEPTEDVMTNLVPVTVHRVVDLPIGTVFREGPSMTSKRYSVVGPDPNDAAATSRAFGFLGAPIGAADFYHVANGDRGVYVRRSDVADVRTADLNVGA